MRPPYRICCASYYIVVAGPDGTDGRLPGDGKNLAAPACFSVLFCWVPFEFRGLVPNEVPLLVQKEQVMSQNRAKCEAGLIILSSVRYGIASSCSCCQMASSLFYNIIVVIIIFLNKKTCLLEQSLPNNFSLSACLAMHADMTAPM